MNASHTIHVIVSISAIAIPAPARRLPRIHSSVAKDRCMGEDNFRRSLLLLRRHSVCDPRSRLFRGTPDAFRSRYSCRLARIDDQIRASRNFMVQAAVVAFSLRRPGIAQAIALTWALWPPICAFFGKYGVDARWICAWYREILLAARTSQGNVLSIAGVARKWVVLFFKSIRAAEGSKPVALFGVGVRVRRWTPFLFHAFACRTYIVFTTIAIRPATSTTTFRTHLSPCFSWTYPIFQRSPFVHQQQKIDREMSDPTDESARSSGVRSRHGPWHGGDRRFR
eukprot:GEMP01024286.1.p1 GENE.GEMP01024286.1~~GEMP01024286.1.p1  ORF type:complete len:282 (-),score=25.14 GEMP01024286.1:764-1609(-)